MAYEFGNRSGKVLNRAGSDKCGFEFGRQEKRASFLWRSDRPRTVVSESSIHVAVHYDSASHLHDL